MKKYFTILTLAIAGFGLFPAYSQFGAAPGGSQFGNGMAKLFGNNQTFSATLEMQTKDSSGDARLHHARQNRHSIRRQFRVSR